MVGCSVRGVERSRLVVGAGPDGVPGQTEEAGGLSTAASAEEEVRSLASVQENIPPGGEQGLPG